MKSAIHRLVGMSAVIIALALLTPKTIQAAVIYESATLGSLGNTTGFAVSSSVYLGSRFEITETTDITAIGGHFWDITAQQGDPGGGFFGAIISLSSTVALPSFNPSDLAANALASTTFNAPVISAEVITPLSVTLDPGIYGLVFGSGLFGATGSGAMPSNGSDLPGASYFSAFMGATSPPTIWSDGGHQNTRFVVEGDVSTVIPLPAALPLFGTGLGLLGLFGWFRRRKVARVAPLVG